MIDNRLQPGTEEPAMPATTWDGEPPVAGSAATVVWSVQELNYLLAACMIADRETVTGGIKDDEGVKAALPLLKQKLSDACASKIMSDSKLKRAGSADFAMWLCPRCRRTVQCPNPSTSQPDTTCRCDFPRSVTIMALVWPAAE